MGKEVFIQTSKEHRKGSSVTYNACTVQFDDNCVAEVTEKKAEKLLNEDDSLSKLSEKEVAALPDEDDSVELQKASGVDQTDEITTLKVEIENLEIKLKASDELLRDSNEKLIALKKEKDGSAEELRRSKLSKDDKSEENKMAKELQKLKVKELNEMAIKAELPQEEWEALSKDEFVWYLIKNS